MPHRILPPVAFAGAQPPGAGGCFVFLELSQSLSVANRRGIGKMRYSNVKNDYPSWRLQVLALHLDADTMTDEEG
jgi:hypothetical protein